METFADRIIKFNKTVDFSGKLPAGISIMNPFKENKSLYPLWSGFYRKYYDDNKRRHMILGINPGRFGGGVTGIPFTDTKRLIEKCELNFQGDPTHELSSVFVYDMIEAFGGVTEFYKKFYINSVCPLGFTATGNTGREVNYNYYDNKELTEAVNDFIVRSIRKQIAFGIETDVCFCFGNGKNEKFLRQINEHNKFFKKIIALEHPRYIMQYKTKSKQFYIDKYLSAFRQSGC